MTLHFTAPQKLAVESEGNSAVSAGAGSGKTRVLVEKYFRVLVDEHPDWSLRSVAAITFTVKAASELRARILGKLREGMAAAGTPPERLARLREIREQIAEAPIGTIHHFCGEILREFAFEAGIDPDFAIIEGVHQASLLRESVEAAIEEAAADTESGGREDLLLLLTLFGRRKLHELLARMMTRRGEFEPIAMRYAQSDVDSLFAELEALHRDHVGAARARIVIEMDTLAGRLAGECGECQGAGDLPAAIDSWVDSTGRKAPWAERKVVIGQIRGAVFTKQWTVLKKLEKALGTPLPADLVKRLAAACKAADSAMLGDLGEPDRGNLDVARTLGTLFLRAVEIYRRKRSAAATPAGCDLLDFADLELRAEDLLRNNGQVRRKLQEEIRFLIIDEFQDTSELQWRLIKWIVCDDAGTLAPARFFLVGDPKQAIYGFRHAGGRVFGEACRLVAESREDRTGGVIPMNDCFRTLDRPLNLVNSLFGKVMTADNAPPGTPADGTGSHEVAFDPLVLQRKVSPGFAALLLHPEAGGGSDAETGKDEPAAVADVGNPEAEMAGTVIANLLKTRVPVLMRGADGVEMPRPAEPGDIAILFRKRKHFGAYEDALRKRGIDFVTHRGKGLYDQPEIQDLMGVLKAVSAPQDDLALLQVLRGSLVNFTDDLLLTVSLFPGGCFREKCLGAVERGEAQSHGRKIILTGAERERAGFATGLLEAVGRRVGLVGVDVLLREVMERTGAVAIYSATERARQAVANMEKLIQNARDLGTADLAEFIEFIDSQADDPQGEGEAPLTLQASAAVKIMTVHAAKGLEFPIVVLPELGEKFYRRAADIVCDGAGWFTVAKSLSLGKHPVFLHAHLTHHEAERSAAEEKRVFCVAATRCRDQLYLCATDVAPDEDPGDAEDSSSAESCLEWIKWHVASRHVESLDGLLKEAGGTEVREGFPVLRFRCPVVPADVPDAVQVHDGGFELALAGRTQAVRAAVAPWLEEDRPGQEAGLTHDLPPLRATLPFPALRRRLAVTQFLDFLDCPELFFRRHVAGLDRNDRATSNLSGGGRRIDPAAWGTLVHESMPLVRNGGLGLREFFADGLAARTELDGAARDEVAEELVAHVEKAKACGVLAHVLDAPECVFEKRYFGCIGRVTFTASFDCEHPGPDGVEVADFKTEARASDRALRRYEEQMRIYLCLLAPTLPAQERFVARLLFTATGVVHEVRMGREEVAAHAKTLEPRIREYEEFAREFCRTEIGVDGMALESLAKMCSARAEPCPAHRDGKAGLEGG